MISNLIIYMGTNLSYETQMLVSLTILIICLILYKLNKIMENKKELNNKNKQ